MSVRWTGLEEFKSALRNLPTHLADEAGVIVLAHAEDAARKVQQAYPEGPTGNLKRGVKLNSERSRAGVAGVVKSTARHAHLFEGGYRGKAPRRTVPDSQKMIPIVVQIRRRMIAVLINMLQKEGLVVTSS